MKKIKFLLPTLGVVATTAAIVPMSVSCSNVDQSTKSYCMGLVEAAWQIAVGRQPESEGVCTKYKNNAFEYIDDCKSTSQVMAIAYMYAGENGESGIISAVGRQPECADIMDELEEYAIGKIMDHTNKKLIGLGRAAGSLAEAGGRQPEAWGKLFEDFKNFVEDDLGL